jgi:cob(I)alamin adenosyltransferase
MGSRGLALVNTGNGKGKTTAALGMALRAAGHGMRVLVIEFVKADRRTGELAALEKLEGVSVEVMGRGFLNDPEIPWDTHEDAARKALERSREAVRSGEFDMVILDEILLAAKEGLVRECDVTDLVKGRQAHVHLVLTGRGCPDSVMEAADIVTEMREVKHAYADGVSARRGVEF